MTIRPDLTVNEVVHRYPATLAVFGAAGIDTCCGGAETLDRAAECAGLTWDELVRRLQAAEGTPGAADSPAPRWSCELQLD